MGFIKCCLIQAGDIVQGESLEVLLFDVMQLNRLQVKQLNFPFLVPAGLNSFKFSLFKIFLFPFLSLKFSLSPGMSFIYD